MPPGRYPNPQAGWIGLTQIEGPVGFGIRFGQWLNGSGFEDFEHALVATDAPAGETGLWIVEAEPGGARHVPMHYSSGSMYWLRPPDAATGQRVAEAAISLVKTPYSFLEYDALALRRLNIPAPGLRHYVADTGHMICSQLADEAAKRGGWQLFDDGRWPGDVTPGDIWEHGISY
jgi:hypothetical protein